MNIKLTINNHAIVAGLIFWIWMAPIYAMNELPLAPQRTSGASLTNDILRVLSATDAMIWTSDKEIRAEIQRQLIKEHGKRSQPGPHGFAPDRNLSFFEAIQRSGSSLVAQYAVHHKKQGTLDDVYSLHGATPLLSALERQKNGIAFTLLEYGADPNAPHRIDYRTPLQVALRIPNLEIQAVSILHLLDHGARPDAKEDAAITALLNSLRSGISSKIESRLNAKSVIRNNVGRYLRLPENREENSEPPPKRQKKEIPKAAMADNSASSEWLYPPAQELGHNTVFSTPEGPRLMLNLDFGSIESGSNFSGWADTKEWPNAALELSDDIGVREELLAADDEPALPVFPDLSQYEMMILARDKNARAHIQRTSRSKGKREYGPLELDNKESFLKAIRSASFSVVKKYADYHKERGTLNNIYGNKGSTPLIVAISARKITTVFTLLECGADPNAPREDARRLTPLQVALLAPDPIFKAVVILHLLDHGADPGPEEDALIQPLIDSLRISIAHKFGVPIEVAQFLKPPQNTRFSASTSTCLQGKEVTIFRALIHGNIPVLKEIAQEWQQKGWINSRYSERGLTPLHIAITSRSLERVKIIVQMGGDINRPNLEGVSPLQYALDLGGRPNIVAWLQAQGARF